MELSEFISHVMVNPFLIWIPLFSVVSIWLVGHVLTLLFNGTEEGPEFKESDGMTGDAFAASLSTLDTTRRKTELYS